MQNANDDTAVIVQAEHRDAIVSIRDIVRVDGVDGVLIGPTISRPASVAPARSIIPTFATLSRGCATPAVK